MHLNPAIVERIRGHSRRLVREFGFLDRTLAGSDLSPSAVHALVEIGACPGVPAKQLSELLLLEKSTVSRLLKSLMNKDLLQDVTASQDRRVKGLSLTPLGRSVLADIDGFAIAQVRSALVGEKPEVAGVIETGLAAYADALESARRVTGHGGRVRAAAELHSGYAPGQCGRITQMHALYYSALVGFGLPFETRVAGEMAEFLTRLERPCNNTWHLMQAGQIQGSVSIDGEDLTGNIAHLRWFIVGDGLRGAGFGNQLIEAAMAFCRQQKFDAVHLWTFKGLDAARALYEKHGFCLAEEWSGDQWGEAVTEQKFVCELTALS